jgi:hypothetical protein
MLASRGATGGPKCWGGEQPGPPPKRLRLNPTELGYSAGAYAEAARGRRGSNPRMGGMNPPPKSQAERPNFLGERSPAGEKG